MTAAVQMTLGGSSVLALAAVFTVAGAALFAAFAAWRASRASRDALALTSRLREVAPAFPGQPSLDPALVVPAPRPRNSALVVPAQRPRDSALVVPTPRPWDPALVVPALRPRHAGLVDERGFPEVRLPDHGPTTPAPRENRQSSGATHPPDEPAGERLQGLEDPDPLVRVGPIEVLRGHPPLVDPLLGALHDDYPVVRRQAVRSLREAGGPRVTRALLDAANHDPSAEVREEAVAALAAMLRHARSERQA